MKQNLLSIVLWTLFLNVGTAAEKVPMPLVSMSGANSEVREASYQRVESPDTWARIWAKHLGTSVDDAYRAHLEVDFDRCEVVVIFRGEQINARGVQIDSTEEMEDAVIVRFTQLGYQTAGASNNEPPDRPYAFIVIPTTQKSIVLKENFPTKLVLQR
jgi:hypothetical protein